MLFMWVVMSTLPVKRRKVGLGRERRKEIEFSRLSAAGAKPHPAFQHTVGKLLGAVPDGARTWVFPAQKAREKDQARKVTERKDGRRKERRNKSIEKIGIFRQRTRTPKIKLTFNSQVRFQRKYKTKK